MQVARFFLQNSAWIESISHTERLSLGRTAQYWNIKCSKWIRDRTRDIPVYWWEGGWFWTGITHSLNGQFCVSFHGKIPFMIKETLPETQNVTKQLISKAFLGRDWWTSSCLSQVWLHYTAWLCWVVINPLLKSICELGLEICSYIFAILFGFYLNW